MSGRPVSFAIRLALAALLLAVAPAPASAVTDTFNNANGAGDGKWNTNGNWTLNRPPHADEDAVLSAVATLDGATDGVANSIDVATGTSLTVTAGRLLTIGTGTSSIAAGVT